MRRRAPTSRLPHHSHRRQTTHWPTMTLDHDRDKHFFLPRLHEPCGNQTQATSLLFSSLSILPFSAEHSVQTSHTLGVKTPLGLKLRGQTAVCLG